MKRCSVHQIMNAVTILEGCVAVFVYWAGIKGNG